MHMDVSTLKFAFLLAFQFDNRLSTVDVFQILTKYISGNFQPESPIWRFIHIGQVQITSQLFKENISNTSTYPYNVYP